VTGETQEALSSESIWPPVSIADFAAKRAPSASSSSPSPSSITTRSCQIGATATVRGKRCAGTTVSEAPWHEEHVHGMAGR